MQRTRVGIIGTGMTALSIGYYLPLVNPQVEIVYFDKAGKVGGRVATRRSRQNQQILFDHGAPYLYKDHLKGDFSKVLEKLGAIQQVKMNFAKAGALKQKVPFKTKTDSVFIGNDGFDSITSSIKKHLKNVDRYLFDCRVSEIRSTQNKQLSLVYPQSPKNPVWDQIAPFSRVFCCIPFPQAQQLNQNVFSFQPYKQIKSAYHAKWVVLLTVNKGSLFQTYKDTDVIDFSGCKDSPIKYAVKQNKKFKAIENSEKQNWAIYFSQEWTQNNLKLTKQQVEQLFVKEIVGQYLTEGSQSFKPQFLKAHRWLYSSPKETQINKPLISEDKRLIFAGDWVGNRQNIGQCWQLGREIVKQLYGLKDLSTQMNKSKL